MTGNHGVDVVLWDIGQVVYQSPFERFAELENFAGMPAGTLPRGPFATGGDPTYDLVDSGALGEPEYWAGIEAIARESVPGLHIYDALRTIGWEGRARPVVVELLNDIPSRYRQAVLTNDATKFLGAGWRETWELAGYFESIVDSLDIGVRKPDSAAYLATVDLLNVPAHRVLFIDDLTVNIDGAQAAGLQGFRFETTDAEGSVAALREQLGLA
ncbi:MAG: HAD-IA family hydrolase [Actinomycetes bacterium]|jgi:putative hydrolase of the HAD superfamily